MAMQTPSQPRNRKRLLLWLGILLLLLVAGSVGGYALLSKNPAHPASTTHVTTTANQQSQTMPKGVDQTPGGQISSNTQQDGTLPDVNHFIQSGLNPQRSLSGGGCVSYYSHSPDATVETNGQPPMYGFENSNDAPWLGLSFDFCSGKVLVTVRPTVSYDYLRIDWWRPGRNGWSQYKTSSTSSTISNAYFNTYYEVTVDTCVSHWYGDSCSSWSPRVYIDTKQ